MRYDRAWPPLVGTLAAAFVAVAAGAVQAQSTGKGVHNAFACVPHEDPMSFNSVRTELGSSCRDIRT